MTMPKCIIFHSVSKDVDGILADTLLFSSTYVEKGKGSLAKGGLKGLGKGKSWGKGGGGKGYGEDPPEPGPKSDAERLNQG